MMICLYFLTQTQSQQIMKWMIFGVEKDEWKLILHRETKSLGLPCILVNIPLQAK